MVKNPFTPGPLEDLIMATDCWHEERVCDDGYQMPAASKLNWLYLRVPDNETGTVVRNVYRVEGGCALTLADIAKWTSKESFCKSTWNDAASRQRGA